MSLILNHSDSIKRDNNKSRLFEVKNDLLLCLTKQFKQPDELLKFLIANKLLQVKTGTQNPLSSINMV